VIITWTYLTNGLYWVRQRSKISQQNY